MTAQPVKEWITTPLIVRARARVPRWVAPLVKILLAFTDIALATVSFTLAFYLHHHEAILLRVADGTLKWGKAFTPYIVLLPLVIPIRLSLLRFWGLYRLRGEFSFVDDLARVFKATAIGSLLVVAAAFMYRGGVTYRAFSYSRGIFLVDFGLVFASVGLVRMLLRTGQIVVRRRGINLI